MVPATVAQAHDVLEATDPANGSSVRTVPAHIGLTFNHTPIAIGPVVRVEDSTGTDQADGPVVIVVNHVTQAVKTEPRTANTRSSGGSCPPTGTPSKEP
jgi:methionine-rich copper-binding protein CopC